MWPINNIPLCKKNESQNFSRKKNIYEAIQFLLGIALIRKVIATLDLQYVEA